VLGRTRVIFIFAVLVGSAAYGDTFTFRDGRIIRGRVLAEFRDHLYVALGAESGSFVKRSELASVVAENGEPLGDSTKPSPALAVSSPAGDVRVEHAGATTAVTELDFAGPKDRIVTGDTGLARLALLTGGVAKLGPSSSVVARPSADRADVPVLVGHPKVSKEHFTLAVVHALANRWGVIDHGSTNGTLVKGRRLEPNTLALVSSGEPVDMADAIRLRFYFAPAALYSVLRAAAPPERVVKCRDELPRLASAMRSLGFDSECDEANGEVKVQSGTDLVVVHASADGFVVEYHKGGLCLRSDLTTIYGSDAEAKLRDLVLANLGFGTEPIDTRTEMETNKKRPPPTAS
jgi:hypothetical protein